MGPKQAQPITMHLGLPDRGRAIKGLVVCYVMWLGSIKGIGLRFSADAWYVPLLWPGCSGSNTTVTHKQHKI